MKSKTITDPYDIRRIARAIPDAPPMESFTFQALDPTFTPPLRVTSGGGQIYKDLCEWGYVYFDVNYDVSPVKEKDTGEYEWLREIPGEVLRRTKG